MIKYLVAILLTASAAYSQTIKTLGYNTTNGQVAYSGSNTLTFTNPLGFSNAATTRTNLGIPLAALTNSNTSNFRTAIGLGETNNVSFNNVTVQDRIDFLSTFHGFQTGSVLDGSKALFVRITNSLVARFTVSNFQLETPLDFASSASAAATRTNLGLGSLATNNSVPSGAAASNSLLTADGAGGSSFVASKTQTAFLTNSAFRTNTTDSSSAANGQTNMVVSVVSNSTYSFMYSFIVTAPSAGGFAARLVHSDTNNGFLNGYVGRQGVPINISATDITCSTNTMVLSSVNFSRTNMVISGQGSFRTGTASGTITLVWYQNSATNVATELVSGSMFSITKLIP